MYKPRQRHMIKVVSNSSRVTLMNKTGFADATCLENIKPEAKSYTYTAPFISLSFVVNKFLQI